MIGMGHEVGGLYYLDFAPISPPQALQSFIISFPMALSDSMAICLSHFEASSRESWSHIFFSCEACQFSKHHCVSFPSRFVGRVSNPFELVHSNVWGPFSVASNKFQYFVTFVDDYSLNDLVIFNEKLI
jgi:hypothetical protein